MPCLRAAQVEQDDAGGLHRFCILAASTNDRTARRSCLVVVDRTEVVLHEVGHLQLLADVLALWDEKTVLTPLDILPSPRLRLWQVLIVEDRLGLRFLGNGFVPRGSVSQLSASAAIAADWRLPARLIGQPQLGRHLHRRLGLHPAHLGQPLVAAHALGLC